MEGTAPDFFKGPFTIKFKAEEMRDDEGYSDKCTFCIENGLLSVYDEELYAVYNLDCICVIERI